MTTAYQDKADCWGMKVIAIIVVAMFALLFTGLIVIFLLGREQANTLRARLSTNAATAGECTHSNATAHRSANPASRGFPSAASAGFNQLAGSRRATGTRSMPCASNRAPTVAHAAGQLRNLEINLMVSERDQHASRAEFAARLAGDSFRFKPFGPIHGRAGGDFASAAVCNGRATASRGGAKPYPEYPAAAPDPIGERRTA